MDVNVERVVDVYRHISSVPSVVSCTILPGSDHDSLYHLESVWQQRDLEREENIKYVKWSSFYMDGTELHKGISIFPPTETKKELLTKYSTCGKMKAIIHEVVDKDKKKVQYLEIWDESKKIININLKEVDKHGDVHSNDQFGALEWSGDGRKILYIAETKQPKTKSFFAPGNKEDDCEHGNEHVWNDSWGEQLTEAHRPTVCVFDISTREFSVFSDVIPSNVSVGQAIWHHDNDSIIFIGWMHEPFRLGLRYCPIRQSTIYLLHTKKGICKSLSDENQSIRSPRLHPKQDRIIFLENPVGGAHMQCSRLIYIDLPSSDDETTKIPEQHVIIDTVMSTKSENDFPGLFLMNLPKKCWSLDGNHIFLTSAWRSHNCVLVIDVASKHVKRLTLEGDSSVLDVRKEIIVISHSSPSTPPEIRIGKFGKDIDVKWTTIEQPCEEVTDTKWSVHSFKPELENLQFPDVNAEYILYQPSDDEQNNKSLVVFPHGGPHSHSVAGFMLGVIGMCKLGFTVVHVNYRGSIGFGKDNIDSLPGKVGTQDVNDVHQVVKKLKEDFDFNKVFVTGGSHGGFLALHLIGQFPNFYSAACVRNPVVNIASMSDLSDIPDWTRCEAGITDFHFGTLPSAKSYAGMLEKSPIVHIQKAVAPVLMMIGDSDLRVPPSQGRDWARKYKALGKLCKVLEYKDNNHPLSKVDAEADGFVNMILWFKQHENVLK